MAPEGLVIDDIEICSALAEVYATRSLTTMIWLQQSLSHAIHAPIRVLTQVGSMRLHVVLCAARITTHRPALLPPMRLATDSVRENDRWTGGRRPSNHQWTD